MENVSLWTFVLRRDLKEATVSLPEISIQGVPQLRGQSSKGPASFGDQANIGSGKKAKALLEDPRQQSGS